PSCSIFRTSTSPTSDRRDSASRRSSRPPPRSRTRSATRRAPTSARFPLRARRCCVRCGRPSSESRSRLELRQPDSPAEAVSSLGNGAVALAGGTELVPLLNDGIVRAETLVELRDAVPRGIDGTRIGAGTTLAELEADPQIPTALREACAL